MAVLAPQRAALHKHNVAYARAVYRAETLKGMYSSVHKPTFKTLRLLCRFFAPRTGAAGVYRRFSAREIRSSEVKKWAVEYYPFKDKTKLPRRTTKKPYARPLPRGIYTQAGCPV